MREQELVFSKKAGTWPKRAVCAALVASSLGAFAAGQAEYDAIIESARSGAHQQALTALEVWSAPSPSIQKINSDITVILRWAGRDGQALELAKKVGVLGLEPYALKSAAVAARNLQDAPWAVAAYTQLVGIDPSDCDARLGLALSLVEARASAQSGGVLDALEQNCTPIGGAYGRSIAQARSYWAARRTDPRSPQELAALDWWSNALEPAGKPSVLSANYQREAFREAILLASRNGAQHLVRRWSESGRADLTGDDMARILSAKAAQQIRWAIATPDDARAKWRSLLDAALDDLKRAKTLSTDPIVLSAIASDTVAALSELGDDKNTLKEVAAADAASMQLLLYAEVAAADALMRANQPQAAEARLRAALARSPGIGEFEQREANVSLFYSLVDQGKLSEAKRLIDERTALVPAFANRDLPGVQVEDDGFVRFQLARSMLLSSSLDGRAFDISREKVSGLLSAAPFNLDIRLNDAALYEARGWPRAAAQATELVLADKPDNTRAMDVAARQALDRGDFLAFDDLRLEMQRLDAHPQMQERLKQAAELQTGFVFAGEALRASGDATDPSGGSSDREAALSLLSPVFQNRWRLKARWRSSEARFGAAAPRAQFFAVGARFYWPYVWAEFEAVQHAQSGLSNLPPGLRVAGLWQIADGVTASAALASRSEELPLRGQAAGESAKSSQLSVDWRALPQTYIGAGLNGFNATDGNRQRGISFYADQAYSLADHWRANLRFDFSRVTNSRSDVAYFSPLALNSYAFSGVLAQDLITAGQTGWTHKLGLSIGEVSQSRFERGSSYSASYEHEWRLSPYRKLSAAISTSRRPYDGVQSRRTSFLLRWSLAL